eukprot:GHVR01087656.1.p1 GENE.GHVR01087656.1~~GHVR01087656.1.p1  ORF type:complete len:208 (+),score=47.93 GHVR01087656.1:427-1050(+)
MSRFGDTAANVGALSLLGNLESTKDLHVSVKTAFASISAAGFRLFLMPIDAWKTVKQVEGGNGLNELAKKVKVHGVGKIWHGSVAAVSATLVGHYPWFYTNNYLYENAPELNIRHGRRVRAALIGFVSSIVSDTCSNSIRVLKTTKQTSLVPLSYGETIREVVTKDGVIGLLGRGLKTRILVNGLQGMVFSVGWRTIQEELDKRYKH